MSRERSPKLHWSVRRPICDRTDSLISNPMRWWRVDTLEYSRIWRRSRPRWWWCHNVRVSAVRQLGFWCVMTVWAASSFSSRLRKGANISWYVRKLCEQRPHGPTLDFKGVPCVAGGAGGVGGAAAPPEPQLPALGDPQQFNIFPAIFSRQLNFSGNGCGQNSKIMDELRPNLVGGLLGVSGLIDDHHLHHNSHLSHQAQENKFMSSLAGQQENKFLSSLASQDNKFLSSALSSGQENRLLSSLGDKSGRKCSNASSSSAEDFGLYGAGLATHADTPAHTPPSSRPLNDQSGTCFAVLVCHFYAVVLLSCLLLDLTRDVCKKLFVIVK